MKHAETKQWILARIVSERILEDPGTCPWSPHLAQLNPGASHGHPGASRNPVLQSETQPGTPEAYNSGLRSIIYGLLWGIVDCCFRPLGFLGRFQNARSELTTVAILLVAPNGGFSLFFRDNPREGRGFGIKAFRVLKQTH